ncbi:MAG: hypothetical protein DBX93_02145 [Oscillospiraceae bacterium]|nr:MAG: hypothetical protein DBX93_02145 [Oscillospiraceae bacterium]
MKFFRIFARICADFRVGRVSTGNIIETWKKAHIFRLLSVLCSRKTQMRTKAALTIRPARGMLNTKTEA